MTKQDDLISDQNNSLSVYIIDNYKLYKRNPSW